MYIDTYLNKTLNNNKILFNLKYFNDYWLSLN